MTNYYHISVMETAKEMKNTTGFGTSTNNRHSIDKKTLKELNFS